MGQRGISPGQNGKGTERQRDRMAKGQNDKGTERRGRTSGTEGPEQNV